MIIQSVKVLPCRPSRLVLVVMLTKALTLFECIQGCGRGWFGEHCERQCNCLASICDKDGNCEKCANGFMGQKCQYESNGKLLTYNAKRITIQPIRLEGDKQRSEKVNDAFFRAYPKTKYTDGQENTCSSDIQETVFETQFAVDILFTWFRIIVNNNANLLNFTMTCNGNMTCGFDRKFIVDNRTVDGANDVPIMVHSVRIEGTVVGSLCEFQVSPGIYLSKSGNISQTSDACPLCGSDKAVDGRTGPDNPRHHCAITKEETNPPSWFLKFFQPFIIHTVVIYEYEELHTGMVVKTNTATGIEIILEQTLDKSGYIRYQMNHQWHRTPMVQLSVTQANSNRGSKKQLIFCEIYVMGATPCSRNTYGLYCTECNCSDTEVCNLYSGGCAAACPVGFYGDNCTLMCPTNCLDDVCSFENGTCLRCEPGYEEETCTTECEQETYGQDCMDICSRFCIGKCDHITGDCSLCGKNRLAPRCIVCPAGFYGTNCSYACPVLCDKVCDVNSGECFNCIGNFIGLSCEDCADGFYGEKCEIECTGFCLRKECDRLSGDCLECIGNRLGANCEECEGHFYGLQCDKPCSKFCFNKTCNAVTGKCDACSKGYQGEFCKRGLGKPEIFTAALSLFPLALLIFFLMPNTRFEPDGEEDTTLT